VNIDGACTVGLRFYNANIQPESNGTIPRSN